MHKTYYYTKHIIVLDILSYIITYISHLLLDMSSYWVYHYLNILSTINYITMIYRLKNRKVCKSLNFIYNYLYNI